MTDQNTLKRLLKEFSVREGEFVLASGKSSSIYVDARLTTMHPRGMVLIGEVALATMQDAGWRPDSVGGLTLGADPVAFAISYASSLTSAPIRAFTVRKELKTHGTQNLIEGPFRQGDKVVITEDVITTGRSALQAIDAVLRAGAEILGILAVVDRNEGGREAITAKGYHVLALTTIHNILEAE